MINMIDVSCWREFRVGELFETVKDGKQVPTGSMVPMRDLVEGDVDRITVTDKNNGVVGQYSVDSDVFNVYENFISISFLGSVFYHQSKASLDMKVHCLKPVGVVLNEFTGLFLVAVIRNILHGLDYTNQISSSMLPSLRLFLPVTSDGEPDWAYMEQYMRAVMDKQAHVIQTLTRISKEKHPVDIGSWGEFHLYDVFTVSRGNKLDKGKMSDGNIAFVGRGATNNGINACVGLIRDHEKYGDVDPYDAGCLTLALGGSIGACFYQDEPFYTSQNVAVLIPSKSVSVNALLFAASVITFTVQSGPYSAFCEELNKHLMTDFSIMLPVTADGKPNWDYMDGYMQAVIDRQEHVVQCLKDIGKG